MYVLDTDVIFRSSPSSAGIAPEIAAWLRGVGDLCYLSTITFAEIAFGVTKLAVAGSDRKAETLARWLDGIAEAFTHRIVLVDVAAARRTGDLIARAKAVGHAAKFEDACIAATADVHGFTVVTFNVKHFAPLGIRHQLPGLMR